LKGVADASEVRMVNVMRLKGWSRCAGGCYRRAAGRIGISTWRRNLAV